MLPSPVPLPSGRLAREPGSAAPSGPPPAAPLSWPSSLLACEGEALAGRSLPVSGSGCHPHTVLSPGLVRGGAVDGDGAEPGCSSGCPGPRGRRLRVLDSRPWDSAPKGSKGGDGPLGAQAGGDATLGPSCPHRPAGVSLDGVPGPGGWTVGLQSLFFLKMPFSGCEFPVKQRCILQVGYSRFPSRPFGS